jgi:hypothetical protein
MKELDRHGPNSLGGESLHDYFLDKMTNEGRFD